MKTISLFIGLLAGTFSFSQSLQTRLSEALGHLENDPQFKHALLGLYVADSRTGKAVFEKNAEVGLAPASCQKLLTSATAFELLGSGYRYVTYIGIDPASEKDHDAGSLFITGQGDPTLGSWRWAGTRDSNVLSLIVQALKKNNLTRFERNLYVEDTYYGLQVMPGGWVWEDMGNYYGAPCYGFNWHENQFDLVLQPGHATGYPTTIVRTQPKVPDLVIINHIVTGPRGSGDKGYLYAAPYSVFALTGGTIPLQDEPFTISGSMPDPARVFKDALSGYLRENGITIQSESYAYSDNTLLGRPVMKAMRVVDSILSPTLDSINHWFLKKSVNLYGEALLKSIGKRYYRYGLNAEIYDSAINKLKDFWTLKGIDAASLNIIDGSGLSPANRLTAHALVSVLLYARGRAWFPSFYDALPELNGTRMKDGYISGVRSYAGYVKSASGTEYSFSFLVNNFSGNPVTVREKMWRLLDILK